VDPPSTADLTAWSGLTIPGVPVSSERNNPSIAARCHQHFAIRDGVDRFAQRAIQIHCAVNAVLALGIESAVLSGLGITAAYYRHSIQWAHRTGREIRQWRQRLGCHDGRHREAGKDDPTYLVIRTYPAAQNFIDLADGSSDIDLVLFVWRRRQRSGFRGDVARPAARRLSCRVVWQSPCSDMRGPFRSKLSLLEVNNHE